MRFPNLLWVIDDRRLAHYEVAGVVNMGESKFSRALNGRVEFSPRQRQEIAAFLGYPVNWLFAQVSPPPARGHSVRPERSPALAAQRSLE